MVMRASLTDTLIELGACGPAVRWAMRQPCARTALRRCQNPDWLIWLTRALFSYEERRARVGRTFEFWGGLFSKREFLEKFPELFPDDEIIDRLIARAPRRFSSDEPVVHMHSRKEVRRYCADRGR